MRPKHLLHLVAVLAASVVLNSCFDEGATNVDTTDDTPNSPPIITAQGPDFPSGGLDVTGSYEGADLWVIVGDPDGLRDIAGVMLEVDSIFVSRIILRPDENTQSCAIPSYAANDTVAVSSLVPTTFPGIQSTPLARVKGGVYSTFGGPYSFFSLSGSAFPDISSLSSAFGPHVKGCAQIGDELDWWGAYAPAVPSDIDVFLTYADIQYHGITVTVYDSAGGKAVATFPDLHIRYTSTAEITSAP